MFDYKRAWEEVAEPAFDALSQNIRDLYERVCQEASGLQQGSNLLMPWPDDPESLLRDPLHTAMACVPSDCLARAAMVIHCYGHWSPHGHAQYGSGGTWKFANYADQILAKRCGLPPPHGSRSPGGFSFYVNDGMLRWAYNDKNCWTWHDIGLATPATLEKACGWLSKLPRTAFESKEGGWEREPNYCPRDSERRAVNQRNFERHKEKLADECWPLGGFVPLFRDIDKHFVEEG